MKNKVLKLCKRLNKVTVAEILPILCIPEDEVTNILEELVTEKHLEKRTDGTYFYIENVKAKPLPLFFECRTSTEVELIKRCFCADLTCVQTGMIMGLKYDIIGKFNKYFRKFIYDKQFNELLEKYNKKPQTARVRYFFETPVYFYFYDDKLYVAEKPLNSYKVEILFNKEEIRKFKNLYCKIRRRIYHHEMKQYLAHHIAEAILRNYISFEELVEFIN